MKPSSEEIFKWAREVYGEDPGKPWHPSAFKHIEALCDIAYAAGAAAMKERCIHLLEDFSKTQMVPVNDTWRMGLIAGANAIRALGDDE